jgi:hypothetical protein
VRMCALGAARCPRIADKEGIIVGEGRYSNSLRILFDGSKLSAGAAALRGDGGRGHFRNLKETALLDQDNDAQACQEDSQVPGYAE